MQTKEQATETQRALRAKGYDLGRSGLLKDGVDGDWGATSQRANLAAIAASPQLASAPAAPAPVTTAPSAAAFTAAETRMLVKLHPDLVRVLARARANGARFRIDCTDRSKEEQRRLVNTGKSKTMESRHIPGADGFAKAFDLYPLDDVDHDAEAWDWDDFYALAEQVRAAGQQEAVPLRWGGAWDVRWTDQTASAKAVVAGYSARKRAAGGKPFLDGPHFELPSALYP